MAASDPMRLFIAIAIPEPVKARLETAQTELRRVLPGASVRWARREQFHLTLKFLGEVAAARVEPLANALRNACQPFAPLRLRLEGVGGFPNLRWPRVLWAGVPDEAGRLAQLQAAVDGATRDFTNEKKEPGFAGHVTLARIRDLNRAEADALAERAAGMKQQPFGQWTVDQIKLMRSELSPQGARHTPLAIFTLAAADAR